MTTLVQSSSDRRQAKLADLRDSFPDAVLLSNGNVRAGGCLFVGEYSFGNGTHFHGFFAPYSNYFAAGKVAT